MSAHERSIWAVRVTLSDGATETAVFPAHSDPDASIAKIEIITYAETVYPLVTVAQPMCQDCGDGFNWKFKGYVPKLCVPCRSRSANKNIRLAVSARGRDPRPDAPEITCACGRVFQRGPQDGGSKRCRECRELDKAKKREYTNSAGNCSCGKTFEKTNRSRGGRERMLCDDCRVAFRRLARSRWQKKVKHATPPAVPKAATPPKPVIELRDSYKKRLPKYDGWLESEIKKTKKEPSTLPETFIPITEQDTFSATCMKCKRDVATYEDETSRRRCGACNGTYIVPILGVSEVIIGGVVRRVTRYAGTGWANNDDDEQ